jgi:hypothetical protein
MAYGIRLKSKRSKPKRQRNNHLSGERSLDRTPGLNIIQRKTKHSGIVLFESLRQLTLRIPLSQICIFLEIVRHINALRNLKGNVFGIYNSIFFRYVTEFGLALRGLCRTCGVNASYTSFELQGISVELEYSGNTFATCISY